MSLFPFLEASHVEVVKVYDVKTFRIKKHILSYTCVLADVMVPMNINKDDYAVVYNTIINTVKNKVFLCKQLCGYKLVRLYDIQEHYLLNMWINNLFVLPLIDKKLLYETYTRSFDT